MVLKNEDKLMANTKLLKTIGLYQILNSSSPKVFGYNIFKCIAIIETFIAVAVVLACILNAFFFLSDLYETTRYFMFGVVGVITVFKMCFIIGYSDTIWNFLHLITSVKYLSYKYHKKRMLKDGRNKSKSIVTLFLVVWITVYVNWMLLPIVVQNSYLKVKAGNLIYHYRTNIMSLVYPATDKFYNDNFLTFYAMEFILMLVGMHCTFMFDLLLILMCTTIECYLKTIANSFSTLGNVEDHFMNNSMPTVRYNETKIINAFKIIIQDQQKVIENMKNIYKVIRPVILLQIAAGSSIIISLSIIALMDYFNGFSLASQKNFTLIASIITFTLELYFICYLLDDVNEQKDSLNFALYSGDWSSKSLKYKKMILYAMLMNNADQLKLQVTMTRIVNLEMFSSVMRTVYTVMSVLSDQLAKQT